MGKAAVEGKGGGGDFTCKHQQSILSRRNFWLFKNIILKSNLWWWLVTLNGRANTSGQVAHVWSRKAMTRPVTAAGLRPPSPGQETAHFVLASCCWSSPPSAPQKTFASIFLWLCPTLPNFSPLQTLALETSFSHPVIHFLDPLLQIHVGSLLTLSSPDHAPHALHPWLLPY